MKTFITVTLVFFSLSVFSQFDEEDNQWWVGLKTGINQTQLRVGDQYSVLSFADGIETTKNYELKYGLGYQVGGIIAWDFYYNFNLTFQPHFTNHKYAYESTFDWASENKTLGIRDYHIQTLNFVDLPLLVRYEIRLRKKKGGSSFSNTTTYKPLITAHSNLTPYVQGGVSYTRLLSASKEIQRVETIDGFTSLPEEELINTAELTNKGGIHYVFGAGVSMDIANSFRIALDGTYKIGTENLTNQKNRFSDDKLTLKYFDAPDDLKISSWQVNIHFLFPLKFIYSPNYKSI